MIRKGEDMDTPLISEYYKQIDPLKRRKLLDRSDAQMEDPEGNRIRRELWEIRYKEKSGADPNTRADGYLRLWMAMEFNRNAAGKLFGARGARKELTKILENLEFRRFQEGSALEKELLYRECCHMVRSYIDISREDRNYNSVLMGLFSMKKESAEKKLQADIRDTAITLPSALGMEKELGIVAKAAREVYELMFSEEEDPYLE